MKPITREEVKAAPYDDDVRLDYNRVLALLDERDDLQRELARRVTRLEIDPSGSDKIDELEQALLFTKHERDALKAEVEFLSKEVEFFQTRFRDAGRSTLMPLPHIDVAFTRAQVEKAIRLGYNTCCGERKERMLAIDVNSIIAEVTK